MGGVSRVRLRSSFSLLLLFFLYPLCSSFMRVFFERPLRCPFPLPTFIFLSLSPILFLRRPSIVFLGQLDLTGWPQRSPASVDSGQISPRRAATTPIPPHRRVRSGVFSLRPLHSGQTSPSVSLQAHRTDNSRRLTTGVTWLCWLLPDLALCLPPSILCSIAQLASRYVLSSQIVAIAQLASRIVPYGTGCPCGLSGLIDPCELWIVNCEVWIVNYLPCGFGEVLIVRADYCLFCNWYVFWVNCELWIVNCELIWWSVNWFGDFVCHLLISATKWIK